MLEEVIIKTDGSCVNNGVEGKEPYPGCAFIVIHKKTGRKIDQKQFKPKPTKYAPTENRCEAYAILAGVKWLQEHEQYAATFESDSKTIVDGIVGLARRKANRDIWEQLESMIPTVADRIRDFKLVPRNSNSEVDGLAKQAAMAIYLAD